MRMSRAIVAKIFAFKKLGLRKVAALNAVQIAELLIEKGIV